MRTCAKCGKIVASGVLKCPACGGTRISFTVDDEGAGSAPATSLPETGTRTDLNFDRGAPPETEAPAAPAPAASNEEPWEDRLEGWQRRPWFWPVVAGLVLVLALGVWVGFTMRRTATKAPTAVEDPLKVEPEVRSELQKLIQVHLDERLAWGRELLKRRSPNRFPEELLLRTDDQKAEVRYLTRDKNAVIYHLLVAYHFRETPLKTYVWHSVSMSFARRPEGWVLTGDHWPAEWDVNFE